jgi:hypothetical protein
MRDRIAPRLGPDNTIAVFGVWSGLGLATPARYLTRAILPMQESMNPAGIRLTREFYENPAHRPGLVVIFRSAVVRDPLNPMQTRFTDWYERVDDLRTGLGIIEVYRKKDV